MRFSTARRPSPLRPPPQAYSDGSDSLEILDDETAHTALIDDGEAGFAQSGFTYQSNAQVAAAYNGDNYNLRNGDDADQASWTFTGLDDGAYRVMATWAHKYNNNYNATDAPFPDTRYRMATFSRRSP